MERRRFADKHGGDNGVFVARVRADQIPVTFFIAHHKFICTALRITIDAVTDLFKARQRFDHLQAVTFCDIRAQIVGHNGFDEGGFFS